MTNDIVMTGPALAKAQAQVAASLAGSGPRPIVEGFFDEPTNTATFVVHDPQTCAAVVIDSLLAFDRASGASSYAAADRVIAYVREQDLTVDWILETHVHADHLSAAETTIGGAAHRPRSCLRRYGGGRRRRDADRPRPHAEGAPPDHAVDPGEHVRRSRPGAGGQRDALPRDTSHDSAASTVAADHQPRCGLRMATARRPAGRRRYVVATVRRDVPGFASQTLDERICRSFR